MHSNNFINVSGLKKAVGKSGLAYRTIADKQIIFWDKHGTFAGKLPEFVFDKIRNQIDCECVNDIPLGIKNVLVELHADDLFVVDDTNITHKTYNATVNYYMSKERNTLVAINTKYINMLPKNNRSVLYTSGKYRPVYFRWNNTDAAEIVIMPMRFGNTKAFEDIKRIGELGMGA